MNKATCLLLFALFFGLINTCKAADYRNRPLTEELVSSGITIVDIRTEPEWRDTGVLAGSVLLTFFRPDRSYDLDDFIVELGRHAGSDDKIALLCRRGNRSAKLAALLSERGFISIINITGGIRSAAGNGVQLVPYR